MSDVARRCRRFDRVAVSPAWLLLRGLVRRRLVVLSLVVLAVMVVCAVGAPWIAPYAPQRMDIAHRLAPPSARHLLGSDDFGRDVLTRCMYGARISLTVGLVVVLVSLTCGTVLGVVAGYIPPVGWIVDARHRRIDGISRYPAGDRADGGTRRIGL